MVLLWVGGFIRFYLYIWDKRVVCLFYRVRVLIEDVSIYKKLFVILEGYNGYFLNMDIEILVNSISSGFGKWRDSCEI